MPYGPEQYDRVGIFFDMSNLYFAARDMGIRIDYARLLDFLVNHRRLHRAYAYIGVGPDDESHGFITWLSRNGFRVKTKPLRRYEDGTTKANLDMELAIDLLTQAQHLDVAIIVSGDGDFARLVDAAQNLGLRVEVAATPRQASSELIDVADRFIDLEANARVFARAELPPRDRPLGAPRPEGYPRGAGRPGYGEARVPPNGAPGPATQPPAPATRTEPPLAGRAPELSDAPAPEPARGDE
jgi:uncharacterized LabA/DUF88 family protein